MQDNNSLNSYKTETMRVTRMSLLASDVCDQHNAECYAAHYFPPSNKIIKLKCNLIIHYFIDLIFVYSSLSPVDRYQGFCIQK